MSSFKILQSIMEDEALCTEERKESPIERAMEWFKLLNGQRFTEEEYSKFMIKAQQHQDNSKQTLC